MTQCPDGIADLEGVVGAAKPNAIISIPASWVAKLLAYVRRLEAEQSAQDAEAERRV